MKAIPAAVILCVIACAFLSCKHSTDPGTGGVVGQGTTINHRSTSLSSIPESWIRKAKTDLKIGYGHTSHGSQVVDGMSGLTAARGSLYAFGETGNDSTLELRDHPFSGANDLGDPNRTQWESATRTYLNAHPELNVVMWSWCGQVSSATEADITTYLTLMDGLERSYPNVKFVYMTGHLDGGALTDNLHLRNEQIRAYCTQYRKFLYDFADIESYDPDGNYYADKRATDNCDYDSNGDGATDRNWAEDWQTAHPGEWFPCNCVHSKPLNGNQKAYAAWALWAKLAGWPG